MDINKEKKLLIDLSIIDVIGIIGLIVAALAMQFILQEIPCPLCLLQRFGIMAISFGFLLNIRFGFRVSHYALSLLAAIFTAFVALRQVTLHIMPGEGGYGDAVFGLHMYTWVFIVSVVLILLITILLMLDEQFRQSKLHLSPKFKKFIHATFVIVFVVMSINIMTTFMECGLKQCPDNPTTYKYLNEFMA